MPRCTVIKLAKTKGRATALAPVGLTNIQQLVKVYTLNKDQQWDNQGARHIIQLCGAAEGHVPASQGLTKCGPLENGIANHFKIPTLRTP